MQTKTFVYALVALFAGAAAAAAQTQTASPHDASFMIGVTPRHVSGHAGDVFSISVGVKSTVNQSLALSEDVPAGSGLTGLLAADLLDATKGDPDLTSLKVTMGAGEPGTYDIKIAATSPGGEQRVASVSVERIAEPTAPSPQPSAPAAPPASHPNATHESFALHVDPASASVKPNGSATFGISVRARDNKTVTLEIRRHSGDGYQAAFSADKIDVAIGEPTRASLVVTAGPDASRYAAYEIVATDPATGENHSAYVKLALVAPAPSTVPQASPTPSTSPSFMISIEPATASMKPGSSETFRVLLHSRHNATLTLGLGQRAFAGWNATLGATSVDVLAGEPTSIPLAVSLVNPPSDRTAYVEVYAYDAATKERHAAHLALHAIVPESYVEPVPSPEPSAPSTQPPASSTQPSAPSTQPASFISMGAGTLELIFHPANSTGDGIHMTISWGAHDVWRMNLGHEEDGPRGHGRLWLLLEFGPDALPVNMFRGLGEQRSTA